MKDFHDLIKALREMRDIINERHYDPRAWYVNVGLGTVNFDNPRKNKYIDFWMEDPDPGVLVLCATYGGKRVAIAGDGKPESYKNAIGKKLLHSQTWKLLGIVGDALVLPLKDIIEDPEVNRRARNFIGANSVTLYSFD